MSDGFRGKVAKGVIWTLLEQASAQVVNFGLGIVLARLLPPSAHGSVAMVMVFVSIATVMSSAGFGQALVQKKDADKADFNAVFHVSLAVSLALAALLCLAAPAVAGFYGMPELCPVLRCLSANVPITAVGSVLNASLSRQMRFDLIFRVSLAVSLTSAAVGTALAFGGFGVWAIVWSSVCSSVVGLAVRWWLLRWRPSPQIAWSRLRPLWAYGWKLLARQLLGAFSGNLYAFLIGRFYTPAELAFVNKGRSLPEMFANTMSAALVEPSFPALSRIQDDRERLREAASRLLMVSSVVILPSLAFLFAVVDKLVLALYGEAWLPCVPFVRLTCVSLMFMPLTGVCSIGMLAVGRSDVVLKLDVGNTVLSLAVMVTCFPLGVLTWVAAGVGVSVVYGVFVYCAPCRRLFGYSRLTMLRDAAPALALAGASALAAWAVGRCVVGTGFAALAGCLALQGAVAALVVAGIAWFLRPRAVRELLEVLGPRLPRGVPVLDSVVRHFQEDNA